MEGAFFIMTTVPAIYTIGHSTRSIQEFLGLLRAHEVKQLVDVRTIPKSRRHPHFGAEQLKDALGTAGIRYEWMKDLGGLRKPLANSMNSGWRNDSFRGYADYMQTPVFTIALDTLLALAAGQRTAIMCAEAVPWRCHRNLIADALVALRGANVFHIMSESKADPHKLSPFAHVKDGTLVYPAESEQPDLLVIEPALETKPAKIARPPFSKAAPWAPAASRSPVDWNSARTAAPFAECGLPGLS